MPFEYGRQRKVQDDFLLKQETHELLYEKSAMKIQEYVYDDKGIALLLGKVHFNHDNIGLYLQIGEVVELKQLRQKSIGLRDRMLLLTFILALALGFITFLIATYLTRPIRSMISAAVKIGEGEENVNIPMHTHDEIGVLGAALQHMVQQLDETQRKTEAMNVSLEEKVSLRTAQLARLAGKLEAQNAELEKAVLNAEHAATAKSEFLATMSHEIRTPLNGILGLTELLLSTEMSASQRENLIVVQASGEALLAILNDILDFSKIEAGLMEIHPIEFNPNHIIEHVSKLFSKHINVDKTRVELITRGVPNLPNLLMGDAGRLQQVMMNLLSNAVKFTSDGDIIIAADVISESDESIRISFKVQDTGKGISKADQEELFNEFTQADGTDTRKHGGTGLGLAIVKRLVKLMGGEIVVKSEIGKGSTFFFELTLKKASEITDTPQSFYKQFAKRRMLIVDGNAASRDMFHDALTAWGMHCDVSTYSKAALQNLQSMARERTPYDLVMIDQKMQEMDGSILSRLIKKDSYLTDTKVIIMTSSNFDFDEEMRSENGLDGFMRKPVYLHSLFETMLSVMGVRERQNVLPEAIQAVKRSERILLAEDNSVNQLVAMGMLKHLGFMHVDVAKDGREAVRLFTQHSYDLILMDIQMPELDGIAATREIRTLEQRSNNKPVPIIAVTAHSLPEDKQRSYNAGMNDHLTKPLTGAALQTTLAHLLSRSEADEGKLDGDQTAFKAVDAQDVAISIEVDAVKVIDEAVLHQLRTDMGFGIGMILDTYVDELPKQVASILDALNSEDADKLRRNGHRLKGSSRSVGAGPLGELCFQLEKLGQDNDVDAAKVFMDELIKLSEQVEKEFSASWLNELR